MNRVARGRAADKTITESMRVACALVALAATVLLGARDAAALCGDLTGDGFVTASDALAGLHLSASGGYDGAGDIALAGATDGRLSATDALAVLRSALAPDIPPCADAVATRAVVVTASQDFASGGIAEITLDGFRLVQHQLGFAAGDSAIRAQGDRVFVLNRFAANNLQELDPHAGLATIKQCSVGAGANPHDVVVVSETKAYMSQYDRAELGVVDPSVGADCAGFVVGGVDLSDLADGDGIPEMDQMVLVGDHLFVALQLLDRNAFFVPTARGLLAVVDVTTDEVVGTVPLDLVNPFSETKGLVYDRRRERIYVGSPGVLFADMTDGGIEVVDPATRSSEGVLVDGSDLGGDLSDFVLVGTRRAYAIVADEDFVASLVEIDLETGTITSTLATSEFLLSDIEMTESGTLCLADRNPFTPGLRCFSVASNDELTAAPVNPGLTPFSFVFIP